MVTLGRYARAFLRAYTYDPTRNAHVLLGLLWGVPIPAFSIAMDGCLGAPGRTMIDVVLGHPIHLFFLAHPLLFGLVFGAMGTVRRDEEWEQLKLITELRSLAMTDPLTGVYNRRHAMEELVNMLHRARRSQQPVSVALFDVDDFKRVNETRGHLEGDRVLRDIAQALRSVVRQGDVLARYGGDEFLLVVEGAESGAQALVERAQSAVRERAGIGVSAGIASWPQDGPTPERLLAAADVRLRSTKRDTKFRVRPAAEVTP